MSYDGQVSRCDHVQTVSNYHKRLKTGTHWKLHGVTMKYLPSDLAGMRMRELFMKSIKH